LNSTYYISHQFTRQMHLVSWNYIWYERILFSFQNKCVIYRTYLLITLRSKLFSFWCIFFNLIFTYVQVQFCFVFKHSLSLFVFHGASNTRRQCYPDPDCIRNLDWAFIVMIDSITCSFCLCHYVQNSLSYSGEET